MSTQRTGQRGFSLAEVLVAITVLAIAMSVALVLYDGARRSFKRGDNATEQQQTMRIAYDRLVSDIRLSGFNVNPDGDPDRPDEGIEAAYDTAIVIRADYDAEEAESTTPEQTLSGGAMLTVLTGNDEIVAYVLAKEDGSSTDTLSFDADVKDSPRDGEIETVSIPNVALVHDDPPYNLYRITLNNDTGTWGGGAFLVRGPLAENVRSMTFRYFGSQGTQLNAFDPSTPAEDIGGADTAAALGVRSGIRRIEVSLEGLTRDPDLGWEDPDDPDPATRSHRKLRLSGAVTPRNLGRKGQQDLGWDVTPPSPPAAPTLVPGHCEGLYVSWPPNPPDDKIAAYRINYGTTPGSPSEQRTVGTTAYYMSGLAEGETYHVSIQATDPEGNWSLPSPESSALIENLNQPLSVDGLGASQDLRNQIHLWWNKVEDNSQNVPPDDPVAPRLRDLAGYRIHWGTSAGFAPSEGNRAADEHVVTAQENPAFTDPLVVNCRQYYYKVLAVDACGLTSELDDAVPVPVPVAARASTTIRPAAPEDLVAVYTGAGVRLFWSAVVEDEEGIPIYVDRYNVYRSSVVPVDPVPTSESEYTYVGSVHAPSAPTYEEEIAVPPAGSAIYYRVRAYDECPNVSDPSEPATPSCSFEGRLFFAEPQNGAYVTGAVPVEVRVEGGDGTYTGVTLDFDDETDGTTETVELVGPGPVWPHTWTPAHPSGYTLRALVENAGGCKAGVRIHVEATP